MSWCESWVYSHRSAFGVMVLFLTKAEYIDTMVNAIHRPFENHSHAFFLAHQAPVSRHSPQLVPFSLTRSFIILPHHPSHSS